MDEFEEHENQQDNEDTKSLNLKEEGDNDSDSGHSEYLPTKTPIRGKRKRGRPRKHPVKVKSGRPRGRPPGIYRKIKAEDLEDDGKSLSQSFGFICFANDIRNSVFSTLLAPKLFRNTQ